MMSRQLITAALAAVAMLANSHATYAQTLTPDQLAQRAIERRAVEAVNWGMHGWSYTARLYRARPEILDDK